MRERTRHSYEEFWVFVNRAFDDASGVSPNPEVQKMISDLMVYFLGGQMSPAFHKEPRLSVMQ